MPLCMEPKRKKGPGRPATGRKKTVAVFARIPGELDEALEKYLATLRPRPTRPATLIAALEDFLAARGFWRKSD